MQPNLSPASLQNLCELREAKAGTVIPQNAAALSVPSGRTYEAGHRLSKKEAEESLYVYRSRYCLHLNDVSVVSWVTEQWPNGAFVWCELELRVDDPVELIGGMSNDSIITATAVEDWIRPRLSDLLAQLGKHGSLTSEVYWPEIANTVLRELRLPDGLDVIRFDLRKVRTEEQAVMERRLKEDFRAKLQEAVDDGTLRRLASQERIEEFVRDLEKEDSCRILTAVERQQEAIERLVKYIELCGVSHDQLDQKVLLFHQESSAVHQKLFDSHSRIIDLLEQEAQSCLAEDDVIQSLLGVSKFDEIDLLSTVFFTKEQQVRRLAAKKVCEIAPCLRLDEVLLLCNSKDKGKRVAGFIAVTELLRLGLANEADNTLRTTITKGLRDRKSRVRYRALQAIGNNRSMLQDMIEDIESLAKKDSNDAMQQMASKILLQNENFEHIRKIIKRFDDNNKNVRISTAREVRSLALSTSFEGIRSLCLSEDWRENVAGFITLTICLEEYGIASGMEERLIVGIVENGLSHQKVRVRYRALQATSACKILVRHFVGRLQLMANKEKNIPVRNLANTSIGAISE